MPGSPPDSTARYPRYPRNAAATSRCARARLAAPAARRWAAATLLAAGGAAGCYRPTPVADAPRAPGDSADASRAAAADSADARAYDYAVPILVESRHHNELVVYVARGNFRQRLGNVGALGSRQFVVPASFASVAGGVYFQARAIGSREGVRSEAVVLQRDQRLVWRLEARLAQSFLSVQ